MTECTEHKLENKRFHLNIRKYFFTLSDGVMEQVAKRGRGVFLLGDFQKASEYGPRQRALGGPASVGGLDQMTSKSPF